jgi:DNA-directed RNA polymerase subunit F
MNKLDEIKAEIGRYLPYDEFVRIEKRLSEIKKEEEAQLKALAELAVAYQAAQSDLQREAVKTMVGKIREISKQFRSEMRTLKIELSNKMPLDAASGFWQQLADLGEP